MTTVGRICLQRSAGRLPGSLVWTWLGLGLVFVFFGPDARADAYKDARKEFRRDLRSDDIDTRCRAYETFAKVDDARVVKELLAKAAREKSVAVAYHAISVLGGFQTDAAKDELVAAIRTKSGKKRHLALLALRDQPGPHGADELLAILDGKNSMEAAQAALALGKKRVARCVPRLIDDLRHEEWQRRAAAARALRYVLEAPPSPGETPAGVQAQRTGQASSSPPLAHALADEASDSDRGRLLTALATALDVASGGERADLVAALEALTGLAYGDDARAWMRLASGSPAAGIVPRPGTLPHAVGIPLRGRRIVFIVGTGTENEAPLPWPDRERLQALCRVPGGRDVPWMRLATKSDFYRAHAKRAVADLPDDASFDVIGTRLNLHRLFGRLTSANPGTRSKAGQFIEGLKLENGVDHLGAMNAALDISGRSDAVAWQKGPDEIVLLAGTSPWRTKITSEREIGARIAMKARLRMVRIHTVGVGAHPFTMMRMIAEATDGTYLDLSR